MALLFFFLSFFSLPVHFLTALSPSSTSRPIVELLNIWEEKQEMKDFKSGAKNVRLK
jgi:hypothetical protein